MDRVGSTESSAGSGFSGTVIPVQACRTAPIVVAARLHGRRGPDHGVDTVRPGGAAPAPMARSERPDGLGPGTSRSARAQGGVPVERIDGLPDLSVRTVRARARGGPFAGLDGSARETPTIAR